MEAEKELEGGTEHVRPRAPATEGHSCPPSLLLGALRFLSPPVPASSEKSWSRLLCDTGDPD